MEMRTGGFYYVDKTGLIKMLLDNPVIDEYDVPLDYAYRSGYYENMVGLIRTLFGAAFKTNDSLEFAVLTGCLRISKESIFTGLNNFKVYTVKDVRYKESYTPTSLSLQCK